MDALRWIRNKFVHNYDNFDDARLLTHQLKNIYREILNYHLLNLLNCESFNLAMQKIDALYNEISK
ncbi:hypothetical protein ACQUW5_15105 [Legionella sp. CNM-1927-20]|uniref:hypothetical protein n=1 Tax=Legionella sp. CNM-1927-20 TaxID=3422221 RepID=UPI00403AF0D7